MKQISANVWVRKARSLGGFGISRLVDRLSGLLVRCKNHPRGLQNSIHYNWRFCKQEFIPRKSTNHRFRTIQFGLKRLAKVEKSLEDRKKREARRYNKAYPGELVHFDTKRLPLLTGEAASRPREYLFVGIDDFSRELYAGIYPDKTQYSAAAFLQQVLTECPYTVECTYSDNGTEYKGTQNHAFVAVCNTEGIGQKFTRCRRPQTNGKAERVIRTLMEMEHSKQHFKDRQQRQVSLLRFINFYNTVKPHKGIDGKTPIEILNAYFYET